jgi:hypothetical protein
VGADGFRQDRPVVEIVVMGLVVEIVNCRVVDHLVAVAAALFLLFVIVIIVIVNSPGRYILSSLSSSSLSMSMNRQQARRSRIADLEGAAGVGEETKESSMGVGGMTGDLH